MNDSLNKHEPEKSPTLDPALDDNSRAEPVSDPSDDRTPFVKDLEALINRHCLENDSDTPDFLLADYLFDCLLSLGRSIRNREKWYGRKLRHPREWHNISGIYNSVIARFDLALRNPPEGINPAWIEDNGFRAFAVETLRRVLEGK